MKATIEITSDGVHYGASINQSIPSVVGTVHAGIQWDQVAELLRLSAEPKDVASTQEPPRYKSPNPELLKLDNHWHWQMEWCRINGLPPADSDVWARSFKEYSALKFPDSQPPAPQEPRHPDVCKECGRPIRRNATTNEWEHYHPNGEVRHFCHAAQPQTIA